MKNESTTSITFHFANSEHFREIYADGVWGGVILGGRIQMAIFRDRYYLPEHVEYDVRDDGVLGNEISRSVPEGVSREIETNLIMNLNVAIDMRDWLTARINEVSNLSNTQSNDSQSNDSQNESEG